MFGRKHDSKSAVIKNMRLLLLAFSDLDRKTVNKFTDDQILDLYFRDAETGKRELNNRFLNELFESEKLEDLGDLADLLHNSKWQTDMIFNAIKNSKLINPFFRLRKKAIMKVEDKQVCHSV